MSHFQESQYPDLINHLLSINHAQSLNENLIETNVCGFVLVKNVNLEKGIVSQTVTPLLLPQLTRVSFIRVTVWEHKKEQ